MNSSELLNLEDTEEIEKGTRGKGDQEDLDLYPTVMSMIIYYMNKNLYYLGRDLL